MMSWEAGQLLGDFTTRSFGESPSEENASRLSQILEDCPLPKYSLSAKACAGILNRAKRRGKELPKELKAALIAQSVCKETESTCRNTFNAWGKEKSAGIIDYIFYGTGKPEEYIVDNATYDPDVTYISDHYPVLLRLSPQPEKYCLTPGAPAKPRYNGPSVLGAKPGHPIYFRLPFSGIRPMTFKASGLPKGLTLDPERGVVSGSVAKAGEYPIRWEARNRAGRGKGSLILNEAEASRWLSKEELDSVPWLPADIHLISKIKECM